MSRNTRARVRYAVVGLGHFAQAAVLPAFAHAADNSELVTLVTGDQEKAAKLSKKYRVPATSYDDFDRLSASGDIDAAYIVVPNALHRQFTERAAQAGIHVLCEKPLAYTSADCQAMIDACATAKVRLMTAYRLHFEEGNLQTVEAVRSGRIGEARLFHGLHTMQVDPDNVRIDRDLGGGPVEDIGVYCINAARYLFRAEPEEVMAFAAWGTDERFHEVPEAVSAVLRFPDNRLASFQCGFGEAKASHYRIIGTKGSIILDPAFTWSDDIKQTVILDDKEEHHDFAHRDQVAAELLYFSNCILEGKEPEPSGEEGLFDVRIIEALRTSYGENHPIRLEKMARRKRPDTSQSIARPPHGEPDLVNAAPPRK